LRFREIFGLLDEDVWGLQKVISIQLVVGVFPSVHELLLRGRFVGWGAMDPVLNGAASSPSEDDEWDADGFEIPSLDAGRPAEPSRKERTQSEETYRPSYQRTVAGTEHIYLGPHGAPPQYGRGGQDSTAPNRKQRLKQKLKDRESKSSASSRENKVEVLQDLMGSKSGGGPTPRGAESEWLDPYCHESQFERPANRA